MKTCTTCGKEWPDDTKFCPNDGSTLRSASGSADLVGSVIADRYHVTKKLGEGGMGAVYLGEHVKMGRKSAIKVMTQSMAHDPDAIARFNREAANAARINHANVCAIYDFGETPDGLIYLAMEFIEGEALTDLIDREGHLPPARAAKIIRQCGEALQAAHDLGIVHRDLKPDNIMIAQGRDGDVVKVVDFGIAKAVGPEEGQNVTKTGLVVGTPEYMSPEQLSGDKLDGRSDIYSLALVLYRMLTGTLPFVADSAQEVMIKRLTDEPMPLNEAMPGASFPDAMQQVMDHATARMPAERYASAAKFARDAEGALGGVAPQAEVAMDTDGATQLISADEAKAAATAQVAKTRVAGKTPTPDTAQPVPSPVVEAPKKKPTMAIAAGIIVVLAAAGGGAAVVFGGGGPDVPPAVVTNDTAATPPANNPPAVVQQPANPPQQQRNPATTTPVTTTTPPATTTTPPAIDSSAIEGRMNDLTEPLLEDQALSLSAKAELESIYSNADMPRTLRGKAARYLMQAFQFEENYTEACRWANRAGSFPMDDLQRTTLTATRQAMRCQ